MCSAFITVFHSPESNWDYSLLMSFAPPRLKSEKFKHHNRTQTKKLVVFGVRTEKGNALMVAHQIGVFQSCACGFVRTARLFKL